MKEKTRLLHFTASVYGKGFIPILSLIFICTVILSAAQFLLAYFLGQIIDSVDSGLENVVFKFIVICIALIIGMVAAALLNALSGKTTNKFMKNIREQLCKKICTAEYSDLEKIKDGDILSIITNEAEGFRLWLNTLYSIGYLPVKIVAVTVFIIFINWKLWLLALPFLPAAVLPSLLLSKKLHILGVAEKETQGEITSYINEMLNFIIVIKSFCLEKLFIAKNLSLLSNAEKSRMKRIRREQIIQAVGRCSGTLLNPLVFIVGAYFIIKGEMTMGQIMSIIFLLNLFGEGANIIYAIPAGYQGAKACIDRINIIFNLEEEFDDKHTGYESKADASSASVIDIRDLSFSYSEKPILKNIDISVKRGEKIAVAGISGSGKTTLFKLLCGLYKTDRGGIYYCGTDIQNFSLDTLRNELSVVPQESFLFNDTIRNNIKIACPGADDEEMFAACKNARIHEFILSLEEGYNTYLKDANKSMSKGQMQRINLARAFLKDAPVYLLDEPTSALDIDTHNAVLDHIIDGTPNRTVIVIIHRLTVPERFDKILFLYDGHIVGFDCHEKLMQENAEYREMTGKISEAIKTEETKYESNKINV